MDESEPSLPSDSDDEDEEDDGEDDVKYPLLLALSAVPPPSAATQNNDVEDDADEVDPAGAPDEGDVALVLRKAIFQALFKAASRKDATEARRRAAVPIVEGRTDRLNDLAEEDEDEAEEDAEEKRMKR